MEDLSKTQIVLLCLLVSFVTSISTGIITFSLLDEAPQQVSQTINRVVERTIETVTPTIGGNDSPREVREVTVVVKEEDLVIDAIEKSAKSIVRISAGGDKEFYGLGLIVTKEGLVAADRKNIGAVASYTGELPSGKTYPLTIVNAQASSDIMFFTIKKESDDKTVFTPASIGNAATVALGQTVIGISGVERNLVAIGRVIGLDMQTAASSTRLEAIETDIVLKDAATGGPLLTLSGEVVGMNAPKGGTSMSTSFLPSTILQAEIQAALGSR